MTNVFHVIKDPVHGTMQFNSTEDSWVKPFIDSPTFQRLRHIKQLGLGDLIFPGAVHSRFNHCLGCCYVGSQIAQKIGLADEEKQLVMIACLLHDIGHGPFSHAFEGIFHDKIIRHEAWTPYFLQDFATDEFFKEYNRINPRYHLTPQKFQEIADMIMHRAGHKSVLADIVSSQLDADRLDYLLRDSHFCGVRYGEFDFRWMLHCMAIVSTDEGERLGITHKGIGVLEHYLMARRLMLRNIYHLQKKLAIETFLVQLVSILAKDLEQRPEFSDIQKTRLGQFLIAANQFNLQLATKKTFDKTKKQFLEKNYANYRELCDYDVFLLIKQLSESKFSHPAVALAQRLQTRVMPKILSLDSVDIETVEAEIKDFKRKHKDIQDWQVLLVQTPQQAYDDANDPIFVLHENGQVYPVNEFSFMIKAISNKLEHIDFLCIDRAISEDPRIQKLAQRFQAIAIA